MHLNDNRLRIKYTKRKITICVAAERLLMLNFLFVVQRRFQDTVKYVCAFLLAKMLGCFTVDIMLKRIHTFHETVILGKLTRYFAARVFVM